MKQERKNAHDVMGLWAAFVVFLHGIALKALPLA
jgi:hypothetical protein